MEKLQILIRRGCYFIEFVLKYIPGILRFKREYPDGVFLVMTPEHQNLGDHAIAFAETQMLDRMGISYFEITHRQLDRLFRLKLLKIMNRIPILFSGGGNLGMLWPGLEQIIQSTIIANPGSTILVLPNTIYYADTLRDQIEMEKSVKVYNSHPELYLYAREKASYEKMLTLYKNVSIVPDMVFSLKGLDWEESRKGCILCLRQDCERTRSDKDEKLIRNVAGELFGEEITNLDMCIGHAVLPAERKLALEEQFAQFRSAELVITDRLHGMIFCAITGTPCIVIDSKSPKVRGCYEWIRGLGYIRFADSPSQIPEMYRTMPEHRKYSCVHMDKYFEQLKEDITYRVAKMRKLEHGKN